MYQRISLDCHPVGHHTVDVNIRANLLKSAPQLDTVFMTVFVTVFMTVFMAVFMIIFMTVFMTEVLT